MAYYKRIRELREDRDITQDQLVEMLDMHKTNNQKTKKTRSNPSLLISAAHYMVEGDGFEPSKQDATDLQSAPFGHSGTPPN